MRKFYVGSLFCLMIVFGLTIFYNYKSETKEGYEERYEDGEKDEYENPFAHDLLEFEKTKDPASGKIPYERLYEAMLYTENFKNSYNQRGQSLLWEERGPIFDSVGPSNGNIRGGSGNPAGTYTSGRIRAVLVDAADPTGNTVFCGGVAGGVWKCTNFLSAIPNWVNLNDFFDNLAISSLAQHPTNPSIMYFSTGEPITATGSVQGLGVWRSTDHGVTWNRLLSSSSYTRIFKVLVDNTGAIYMAIRGGGLRRSNDNGATWTLITPDGISSTASCTDIELSSTGRLHASFGYGGNGTHRYLDNPATGTSFDWVAGNGLTGSFNRIELDVEGNIVYAATTNSSNNLTKCFISTDGGDNWRQKNGVDFTSGISNTQGWYNITVEINPANPAQVILGGLDAFVSVDSGATVTRQTRWVTSAPYVHADHHFTKWWNVGFESRILIGCDGGLFLSRDAGSTYVDKNRNLGLKQFYSCAIHPTLTNYFLGGTQDNGTHQINTPGKTYSIEVTGGDGAFVHINQLTPNVQFGSYVYNQYRRSLDGGLTWTPINISSTAGLFINPFEYDDLKNLMYASNGTSMRRWENPLTATSGGTSITTTLSIPFSTGNLTSFKLSPNTPDRLFVGTSTGRLYRVDNADAVTSGTIGAATTELTFFGFSGYLNCIATGTTDNFLLAIMSNYGVNNVWFSSNGGTTWSAIDGNLPDMPVRWAMFHPNDNNKIIIATEAGVYITHSIDGSATVWTPSASFPIVSTHMLKMRPSDNTILAATHGRGMFTAKIPQVFPLVNIALKGNLLADGSSQLLWNTQGEVSGTKYYVQYSTDGVSFTSIGELPYNVKQYKHKLSSAIGYYRIMGTENHQSPIYSNTISLKTNQPFKGLVVKVSPNPVSSNANVVISNSKAGSYSWTLINIEGRVMQSGKGSLQAGGSINLPLNTQSLSSGLYKMKVVHNDEVQVASFIKQ